MNENRLLTMWEAKFPPEFEKKPLFCLFASLIASYSYKLIPQISFCSCEWPGILKCLAKGLDRSDPLFFTFTEQVLAKAVT